MESASPPRRRGPEPGQVSLAGAGIVRERRRRRPAGEPPPLLHLLGRTGWWWLVLGTIAIIGSTAIIGLTIPFSGQLRQLPPVMPLACRSQQS